MEWSDGETERWVRRVVLGGLAVAFLLGGLYQAAHDSVTVDEAVDVAAGVTSLTRHDLRLNPEHDLLVHILPALPALLAHPVIPDGPAYRENSWFVYTDEFVQANRDAGKLGRVLFFARLVPLLEGLAVAAAIYALANRLLGRRSASVAAGLWLSTPVFLGFSHIVSIDITFTLAILAVCLAISFDSQQRGLRSSVVVGLALGVALLARHSGLILIPAVAVSLLVVRRRAAPHVAAGSVLAAWVSGWVTVWLAFIAFGSALGRPAANGIDALIGQERTRSLLVRLALSVPWPKEWAAGLAYLALGSTARPAYLFGQAWSGGRWWFFPGSLVVKAPLGLLVVFLLLPVSLGRLDSATRRRMAVVLLPVAFALVLQLLVQPLDLGLRYAFPVVALGLVASGSITGWLGGAPGRVGLVALGATQVVAAIVAMPHSLAWTPPPFGAGYRWASDSNVDFGQDERAVERWAVGKQPTVSLLLPRGVDPPPGSRPLLGSDPTAVRGWVAISATRLMILDFDELSWLRAYCPIGTINGTVLVFRFASSPDPRPGPVTPRAVCHSDFSRRG